MKKCSEPFCLFEFPAHYFHNECTQHTLPVDKKMAQDRANKLFEKHGEIGLKINTFTAFLPPREAAEMRWDLEK